MTRQLVLIGASLAHVHLLAHLARQPVVGVQVTLVSPQPRLIYPPRVAEFVAGRVALDDCAIPLEPLLQRSDARWLQHAVQTLDPQARTLLLTDGSELAYDTLSLSPNLSDSGLAASRQALELTLPGARHNALLTHPLEVFCALWPRVPELAATQALRVAVICRSNLQTGMPVPTEFNPHAIELALSIRHRLPGSAVTLITGGTPPAYHAAASLQTHIAQALRERNVTVLMDNASAISPSEVTLGSGARLACDVPVVINDDTVPHWVAESGLALDAHGWIAVDARQHCTSHPGVFASRNDDQGSWANPWAAERTAKALSQNLIAAVTGQPLTESHPGWSQLKLMSCGDGQGIAQWGERSAQGRWAGWLKRRIDHAVVKQNLIQVLQAVVDMKLGA
jgi:NADH dehydrogenase FAD-containing subunit